MRLLLALMLTVAAGSAVAAEAHRKASVTYKPVPRDARSLADCPRPLLQHATRNSSTRVNPLAAMPQAFHIHAVERSVNGCAVYPEAQKVSDRTGQVALPPPGPR